jgi:DNA modification methylase
VKYEILQGDCIKQMAKFGEASVDAVVCDPPYGLGFMGKSWDGADGFRRSLNPNDVDRGNAFGRASRTLPEYRAGRVFQEWSECWATEALRVLKPGGHLLAFGGTRTYHRLACAIEDAA